jgi:hypothetical protein
MKILLHFNAKVVREDVFKPRTGNKSLHEISNDNGVSVGNPEGKRPLGRPRRRWVDNIKMDLREIGWDGMIGSIWLRIGASGGLL